MRRGIVTLLIAALSLFMFSMSPTDGKSPKVRTERLDMQVKRTLDSHVAEAVTKGVGRTVYLGDKVIVMSESEVMYDARVLKGQFVLVGTFSGKDNIGDIKVLPAYMPYPEYKAMLKSGRDVEAVIASLTYRYNFSSLQNPLFERGKQNN